VNKFQMNRQNFPYLVKKLEALLEDAPVWSVAWSKPKEIRLDAQNRLMWKFFSDFAAHVGYDRRDVEDLKVMVTLEVWPKQVMNPKGELVNVPPHTSEMDTKEFSQMMDALIRYAAQLGFIWTAEGEV
jgi:NinB protein